MIQLRDALLSDMDLIFEWVNDPLVRKNSFNTSIIPYEEHRKWYKRILKSRKIHLFILIDDSEPVGQIRLNIEDDCAEISYSICSQFRKKGYGHIILELIVNEVKKRYPKIKKLKAKVKSDNEPSNRLFIKEGYIIEYICYTLNVGDFNVEAKM